MREASASPAELSFGAPSDGQAAFSFQLDDLYSDFYSYASLALANYDRESLLDPQLLANVSDKVFSTFYQNFISLNNGFDGQWAFQPVGAKLPYGLDFEPKATVTTTSAWTQTRTSLLPCSSSENQGTLSSCVVTSLSTTASTTTEILTTYPDTKPTSGTASTSTQGQGVPFNPIITRGVDIRDVSPTQTPIANTIPAVLSVSTNLLVISPIAVFFSIAILAFLLILTVLFYLSRGPLKKLPRDVEFPASLLGFVYASERLREWCVDRQARGDSGEDDKMVKMGRFDGRDGETHWGIEIVEGAAVASVEANADQQSIAGTVDDQVRGG